MDVVIVVAAVVEWLQRSNNVMFLTLVFVAFLAFLLQLPRNKKRNLPPGPIAWPVIGNLHYLLFPGKLLPHHIFAQLAQQYGSIFFLRLGSTPTVVVSSPARAKEFLHGPHDELFANRPPNDPGSRAFYPEMLPLMQYGHVYTRMRKFFARELAKIRAAMDVPMEEICNGLQEIQDQSRGGQLPIDLSKVLGHMQVNITTRMVFGRKVTKSELDNNPLESIIQELTEVFGLTVLGDYIPCLGWLDVQARRRADRLHKLIDSYVESVMAERRVSQLAQKTTVESGHGAGASKDFLNALMASREFNDNEIKAATWTMMTGGIDTASTTVEWAMAELLRNPLVFQKLQEEVTSSVRDEENLANESDIAGLSYLHAVINETFRVHPTVPILLPRMSHQACEIEGYKLPKKTQAIINVWAIGHSSSVWDNPEEFVPERFIGTSIKPGGRHFELLPFGAGRRMCVGMSVGMSMVELLLANLVRTFECHLPPHLTSSNVDMTESGGIVVRRAKPLLLLPKLRLAKIPTAYKHPKA